MDIQQYPTKAGNSLKIKDSGFFVSA